MHRRSSALVVLAAALMVFVSSSAAAAPQDQDPGAFHLDITISWEPSDSGVPGEVVYSGKFHANGALRDSGSATPPWPVSFHELGLAARKANYTVYISTPEGWEGTFTIWALPQDGSQPRLLGGGRQRIDPEHEERRARPPAVGPGRPLERLVADGVRARRARAGRFLVC